mmetsp:Transcript_92660/g.145418  ORF Transcript_92660/g.145418 Transcript_92660/m.145418 type:complete len:527 (-) Transcript_92660:113-1693(-)
MGATRFRWDLVPVMPTPGGRKLQDKETSEPLAGQSPLLVCGLGNDLADKDVDLISGRPFHPPRPKNIRMAESISPCTPRQRPAKQEVFASPPTAMNGTPNSGTRPGARRAQHGMNPLPLNSHGPRPEMQLQTLPRPARAAVVCDGGLSADDCVDADRVPLSMNNIDRGCYRLRKVTIDGLQKDGTLGLLLHGTSVVGFRCMHAEAKGWKKGDQIVEINGRRAGNFDEFQDCFRAAQREDGFPITFSVLRREEAVDGDDNADDALTSFFGTTDFMNLAGQLQKKWSEEAAKNSHLMGPTLAETKVEDTQRSKSPSAPNFTMDNPYIVALQRRRDALFRTNEGWAKWADDDYVEATETIASQLAQKHDGVSMLDVEYEAPKQHDVCGLPGIFCATNCAGNARGFELIEIEMAPTPRVHRYDALNSRDERDPPWVVEATSRASRLDPEEQHERLEVGFVECMETASSSELKVSPSKRTSLPDSEDSDADLLAHLLLSSEEFRLSSDEEDETVAVPRNIAGALISGSVDI